MFSVIFCKLASSLKQQKRKVAKLAMCFTYSSFKKFDFKTILELVDKENIYNLFPFYNTE